MKIAVPKETYHGEKRVPLVPSTIAELIKRGADVIIETDMGIGSGFRNEDYSSL